MRFKPHIIVDKSEIVLKMPYNRVAIDALKARIPPSQRSWDPEAKAWRFTASEDVYNFLRQLVKDTFEIEPPTFTVGGDVSATLDKAIDTTTYYTILGVNPSTPIEEIKKAHRKLVRTTHPDLGGLARHFMLVQEAYETLRDPNKRKRYDAALKLLDNTYYTNQNRAAR